VKPSADQKHILNSIAVIAKKLGRAPSQAEFVAQSRISKYFVLKSFSSWTEAVRAAGLHPSALNARIDDRALLEDWGGAVRRNAGTLPRHMFRRAAKYNPCTLAKRFGGWSSVPQAFRKFARGKQQWADVVALLPAPVAKKEGAWPQQNAATSNGRRQAQQKLSKDRATYGDPIPLQGFRHEPVNEHGVMVLFGMLARDLGFVIEAVQKEFPDCEAKREIVPGRWQRVLIEFEFESKNFREHGHPSDGCDVIVCWRHNWDNCPKDIEVVELSRVIQSLADSHA
jgi:hypothetical protein